MKNINIQSRFTTEQLAYLHQALSTQGHQATNMSDLIRTSSLMLISLILGNDHHERPPRQKSLEWVISATTQTRHRIGQTPPSIITPASSLDNHSISSQTPVQTMKAWIDAGLATLEQNLQHPDPVIRETARKIQQEQAANKEQL